MLVVPLFARYAIAQKEFKLGTVRLSFHWLTTAWHHANLSFLLNIVSGQHLLLVANRVYYVVVSC